VNPLVPIAIAWISGLLVAALLPAGIWQPIVALISLTGAIVVTVKGCQRSARTPKPVRKLWRLLALLATVGAALAIGPIQKQNDMPPAGLARLEVVVESVQYRQGEEARSIVRVLKGERVEDSRPFPTGILLQVGPVALPEDVTVELLAQVRPVVPFRNPSPHPPLPYTLEVQGNAWVSSAQAVKVVLNQGLNSLIPRARSRVRRAINETLPLRPAGIARALVLGDGNAVDPNDKQSVRAAGLSHVFAVSGLHVVVLVGLVVALLQRLLIRLPLLALRYEARRLSCGLGVPIALIYAEFAGSAPSAWRAAFTAAIGWTLVAFGKRPQSSATASAAAIILGALRPYETIHPSFLLSIVATSALLSAPKIGEDTLGRWLKSGFTISLRTTIATTPIVLWCFGSVPFNGLFANVLLVPIASLLLMPLAALHAIIATFCAMLAPITSYAFCTVSNAFIAGCGVFARLPFSSPLPPPDIAQGATVAIAAMLVLSLTSLRSRTAVCILAVLAITVFEVRLRIVEHPRNRLRVTYLDVGQGDAALVDLPDGRLMIVDAGGNPFGGLDPGRAVLLPILQARRRNQIDVAVLSHPHPDHFGGLFSVLDAIPIKELWDTGQAETESGRAKDDKVSPAKTLLEKARASGARIVRPRELCAKPRLIGGVTAEVVWPCPQFNARLDPNDNSFVLRLDYRGRRFLFTGDIEADVEKTLIDRKSNLKADVLKVPHHGSKRSSTSEFLNAVSPQIAVISNAAYNRYGHPANEVIERLKQVGARVIRLDRDGGTVVTADSASLEERR
jgi:competence protein ComEC